MKISMIDHETMEIGAESVADHFFMVQFHNANIRLQPPKPFEHNSYKLILSVRETPPEAKVTDKVDVDKVDQVKQDMGY